MALNVNRNVQDAFYRYKMPRLIAKVEGKGNGVKTVIPNMVEIGRALGRPPTYCTKYFGCELGAQTQFDFRNDRYIVNGAHDAAKLQDMLDGFIKKFVLCAQCENPETVMRVNAKRGTITSSCRACGHTFQLDARHKLTTFIVKNPPDQDIAAHGTSLTKKKDKKSVRREEQQQQLRENGNNGNNSRGVSPNLPAEEGGDSNWGEGEGGGGGGDDGDDGDDNDGDWSEDVSADAVSRRMKELTTGIKGLAMDGDLDKTEAQRVNILHDLVKSKIVVDEAGGSTLSLTPKEVVVEAERLEVSNKAPIVLCELLFDGSMVSQIKRHNKLFLRFTHNNQKAQKYLLGGFEKTVEAHRDALLNRVPIILKTFYDEDILEEEVVLDWARKVSRKYVGRELAEMIHKKAEPFVTWLREAEEESSEEDGEEEKEVELTFDDRAKTSALTEDKKEEGGKEKKVAAEDDLDIDDI